MNAAVFEIVESSYRRYSWILVVYHHERRRMIARSNREFLSPDEATKAAAGLKTLVADAKIVPAFTPAAYTFKVLDDVIPLHVGSPDVDDYRSPSRSAGDGRSRMLPVAPGYRPWRGGEPVSPGQAVWEPGPVPQSWPPETPSGRPAAQPQAAPTEEAKATADEVTAIAESDLTPQDADGPQPPSGRTVPEPQAAPPEEPKAPTEDAKALAESVMTPQDADDATSEVDVVAATAAVSSSVVEPSSSPPRPRARRQSTGASRARNKG